MVIPPKSVPVVCISVVVGSVTTLLGLERMRCHRGVTCYSVSVNNGGHEMDRDGECRLQQRGNRYICSTHRQVDGLHGYIMYEKTLESTPSVVGPSASGYCTQIIERDCPTSP